ncbi:MAG: GtrA-like protein [Marmoricola sp.]|nr:GtrA-like protein [Marmoricola sp.]
MPSVASSARVRLTGLIRTVWLRREIRFLVVGGANTVLGYGLFILFHALLGHHVQYLVLLLPTYGLSIPIAFASQRILVFDTHGNAWVDFARYTTVQLSSIGLNAAVLAVTVEVLGLSVVLGQMVALVVVVVVTYFSHALFSFRRPAQPADPGS